MKRHVAGPRVARTWCGKDTRNERVLMKHGSFNWEETDICCNCYNRCNDTHIREAKALERDQ